MIRSLMLGGIFIALSTVLYAEGCLKPVKYETPRSALELRQPSRLASETLTYPGFPWFIVSSTNRIPLHTIRGNRFEELRADWPKAGWWQYRDGAIRPDGSVLGFGQRPNRVHVLTPGEASFQAVTLPDYVFATYEPYRDVVLLLTGGGALMEWDGAQVRLSHLTGIGTGQNVVLPRYIPEFDLWLALVDGTLLARRAGQGQEWGAIGGEVGKWWGHYLADTNYMASKDSGLLAFDLGGTLFAYNVPETGLPTLAYQVEGRYGFLSGEGETGLILKSHPSVQRSFIGKLLGQRERAAWKEALIVTPDGLKSATVLPVSPNATPDTRRMQDSAANSTASEILRYTPPIIDLPDGRFFYDGTHLVPVPHLSERSVGKFVRWFRWKNRIWALTVAGWHEFMPDLSLRIVTTPLDDIGRVYDVNVMYSALFDGLVVTGETGAVQGAMWITYDGNDFERLLPTGSLARRYLSDIPNSSDALVLGADGLYIFHQFCEGH